MRLLILLAVLVFLCIFLVSSIVNATGGSGTLTVPEEVSAETGVTVTLEDIYQRLLDSTATISGSLLIPNSSPDSTMHTLEDIYNKIPAAESVCSSNYGGPVWGLASCDNDAEICGDGSFFCDVKNGYHCVNSICIMP